jgi:outer membrane protein TolC
MDGAEMKCRFWYGVFLAWAVMRITFVSSEAAEVTADNHHRRLPAVVIPAIRPCAAAEPVAGDDATSDSPTRGGVRAQVTSDARLEPSRLDPDDPFSGQDELSLDQLLEAVETRNPSLQAMIAAWQAASQKYWQVISLDDPMFGFMVSTADVGAPDGQAGYVFDFSQQIPWFGKRRIRGHAAQAQADMAQGEIGVTKLELIQMTRTAFYQYYVARRQVEVNQKTGKLMQEFRDIARSKYEVNQAMQQDVLQAELELADLAGRRSEFARDEKVAIARINTLLLRPVDFPLPPPPAQIEIAGDTPSVEVLQQAALQSRPELYSILASIREEEANLALAHKDYLPDLQIVARYDAAAMLEEQMRPMVGMNVNIPVWQRKRTAAIDEACARIRQRRAEYDSRLAEISFQVQSAVDRLAQGREIVRLYVDRILPAAEENLRAAQANYSTGNVDFLRLLDAERQYNNQQERYQQAVGEYQTRLADLERAIGGLVPEEAE